ncbi:hypothetical protein S245_003107 [Arachis hypogaea]
MFLSIMHRNHVKILAKRLYGKKRVHTCTIVYQLYKPHLLSLRLTTELVVKDCSNFYFWNLISRKPLMDYQGTKRDIHVPHNRSYNQYIKAHNTSNQTHHLHQQAVLKLVI